MTRCATSPAVHGGEDVKPDAGRTTIDQFIGMRLHERRVMLGLTKQQMADMTGATVGQVGQYERGRGRLPAGKLYEISQLLGVPITFFFDGVEGTFDEEDAQRQRMCIELAYNFMQIPSARHREALNQFARALVEE